MSDDLINVTMVLSMLGCIGLIAGLLTMIYQHLEAKQMAKQTKHKWWLQ